MASFLVGMMNFLKWIGALFLRLFWYENFQLVFKWKLNSRPSLVPKVVKVFRFLVIFVVLLL